MSNKKTSLLKLPRESEEFQNRSSNKNNGSSYYQLFDLSGYSQTEQRDIIPFLLRFISQLKNATKSSMKYNKKKKG